MYSTVQYNAVLMLDAWSSNWSVALYDTEVSVEYFFDRMTVCTPYV